MSYSSTDDPAVYRRVLTGMPHDEPFWVRSDNCSNTSWHLHVPEAGCGRDDPEALCNVQNKGWRVMEPAVIPAGFRNVCGKCLTRLFGDNNG